MTAAKLIPEAVCRQVVAEFFRRTGAGEKRSVVLRALMQAAYSQGAVRGAGAGLPRDWRAFEAIADQHDVRDALQGFSEDPTGDNGTVIVRAVVLALAAGADQAREISA